APAGHPRAPCRAARRRDRRRPEGRTGAGKRTRRQQRSRARDGLDLPHRRPGAGARPSPCLDDLMQDDGPSFVAMITLVAVVVATVILVFFGIGYLLGKIFL